MKLTRCIYSATLATAFGFNPVFAAEITEERLQSLEERLKYTEQRIQSQDQTILEQTEAGGISLAGLIEVDAVSSDGDTDLAVSTVELAFGAEVTDGVIGEVVLLYEGETLDVDTVKIGITPENSALSFTAGLFVVPFGVYETNLVSDPLTLELGETGPNAVQADFAIGPLTTSVYAFNGEDADDEADIDTFGVNLGFGFEDAGLGINVGYINDITQSGGLEDYAGEDIPGFAFSALFEAGAFTFIGEYIAANDDLSDDSRPSAMNIEAAMGTLLTGKPATFTLGYQTTDDAEALELPEKRISAAMSVGIMENTSLAFEIAHDTDYADDTINTITARLGVEF